MKRFILFLLILGVITDALYCTIIRPRMSGAAFVNVLKNNLQEAAHSSCVQQLMSGNWLRSPQPLDPLALVPQDTLLMLDTVNAAAAGKTFLNSRFGQALTSVKWFTVLKKLDVPPLFLNIFKQQLASLQSLLNKPLLQDIFSRRTVIALVPPDNSQQLWINPVQNLLAQTLLLTTPRQKNTAAEVLALLKSKRRADIIYYQGISILTLELQQGRKLHVAALDGQIAFSLSLPPLQRSIDLFVRHFIRKKNGLLRVSDYVEMKQEAQGDDFFLYANLVGLKNLLGQQDTADVPSGTRSMSLFHQRKAETEYFKSIVRFSPEHLQPLQREFYTARPQRNRSLRLMPAELLLYFWTSWLDTDFLQQTILAADKKSTIIAAAETWLKKQTNMDFEEVSSLFGPEFSFNIAEISTTGFFPVPRLGFVIAIREQEKAERFVRKLLTGLPLKSKKTNGTTIVSLQVAKGLMLPSYAFTNGFLLMADSQEQLVDILSNNKEKMAMNKSFQAVDIGMFRPSNALLFARVAELVNGLQELAAWAGTMIAVRDEETGAKSKVLVDEVISPLLDGLSTFTTVSLRSYVKPGELILETAAWQNEQTKKKKK